MNGLHRPLFYGFCVLFVLLSGCVSTEVGDARYQNNGIQVSVNSSSAMPDAFMQVTIYEVKGLQQQESLFVTSPVNLTPGENKVFFPARCNRVPINCAFILSITVSAKQQ